MIRTTTCVAAAAALGLGGGLVCAEPKADGRWRGSGGAAFSAASGNTRSVSLLLDAEAGWVTDTDRVVLGAKAHHARSRERGTTTTAANKRSAIGEYAHHLAPRLYVFGKLGLESDELIALRLRRSLAAGVGFQVAKTPTVDFELFGGAGHTADRYSAPQSIGGRNGIGFSRASLYLGESSVHRLSATTSIRQRLELYPPVGGDHALLAKFGAALAVALSGTLSLNVGFDANHNSRPAAGVKATDTSFFTGVNFKFGPQ